ncbi:patatin-like phospholipase family protein [Aeromicrobium sp.]|uniref:patatin-like phospholipase family protein n=1 Tax=Aeromicrobium sp. TaxID=1871063 RepID=UPI003D6A1680
MTPEADPRNAHVADLVLEGGGVKGIALAGAVWAFDDEQWTFPRIAGTSAGAMAGAVIAALQAAGEPLSQVVELAKTIDYRKFRDRGFPGSWLGPLGALTDPFALVLEQGAYEGDYLHDWVRGVLADLGVHTFGDLRRDDPADDGHIHHQYSLVVTASDISRKRLVYLPWDYAEYGLDPDEQSVADAVRASASIPYFFEPVTLSGTRGRSTLVDGGLLSNYPISAFDRLDDLPPRWATLGIRLDALGIGEEPPPQRVRNLVSMGIALIETAIEANQAEHVLDPCNVSRSVYVDTRSVGAVDFSISEEEQRLLVERGHEAAADFLAQWEYDAWLRRCRPAWT